MGVTLANRDKTWERLLRSVRTGFPTEHVFTFLPTEQTARHREDSLRASSRLLDK